MSIQNRIQQILAARKGKSEYRQLSLFDLPIDFSSNDYLGLSRSAWIKNKVQNSINNISLKSGSTGSRLLTGNSALIESVETRIAQFHNAEKALIFSSGFDANLGLVSTVCRAGDIIFYDELVHASIRQGIKLSDAKSISFSHNNLLELKEGLAAHAGLNCFVIIESVYSMDGDKAPLKALIELKKSFAFECIVDEAHALGIFGENGRGLCEQEQVEKECLARVYTFGKALGAHGAAVVGPAYLIEYLINFCKPFIYSTAPSSHFYLTVEHSYIYLLYIKNQIDRLHKLINHFNREAVVSKGINIIGEGPIFGLIVGDAMETKRIAKLLNEEGFDVRPIVYPTVAKGVERIRICLHSFNTEKEIDSLFLALNNR